MRLFAATKEARSPSEVSIVTPCAAVESSPRSRLVNTKPFTLKWKHPWILALVLSACGTNPPPITSSGPWDFSVSISDGSHLIPQAHVTFNGIAKDTNDFGWAYYSVPGGCYPLSVTKDGYEPYAPEACVTVDRHKRVAVTLTLIAPPTPRLQANGRFFTQDGKPFRWKGVSAFQLLDNYCKGESIDPFLSAFQGFNVLRVFWYWETTGSQPPSDECAHRFFNYTAQHGWYVELVALTGPKPIADAQALVSHLFSAFGEHANLLIELVNEPGIHDKVDPAQLTIPQTAIIWTDGLTDATHRGLYLTAHTARDDEWPRRSHDLLEYWTGGGPATPQDPAWKQPAIADEPIRPDEAGYVVSDFEAYFGGASIMGAGGTFHCESCKYGHVPTQNEQACADASLKALNYFPADAPNGPYQRIDEHGETLRTYKVGFNVVRVRPKSGPILSIE